MACGQMTVVRGSELKGMRGRRRGVQSMCKSVLQAPVYRVRSSAGILERGGAGCYNTCASPSADALPGAYEHRCL